MKIIMHLLYPIVIRFHFLAKYKLHFSCLWSGGASSRTAKSISKSVSVTCIYSVLRITGYWLDFSHLITKPVLKISRISKEMSELQFEWQLDEQRTDELGILAKSLNYLSQKLNVTLNDLQAANRKLELDIEHEKALEQARTNFFSAVSHELKTPITIIKGQLEGMLLGIGPYKDHERYLTRSLEITNTLETMVQDILTISRLETAGADFKKDHLDCVQIIKAYLNETADLIAEKIYKYTLIYCHLLS